VTSGGSRRGYALIAVIALAAAVSIEPVAQPSQDAAVDDPNVVMDDPENPSDDTGSGAGVPAIPPVPADPAARDAWLVERLTQATANPALGTSRVGAVVVDLATGKTLWSKDPDGRYNLASNAKVFTAATALARLGAGFRWRTAVMVGLDAFDPFSGEVDGDLYIKGRGDPTLSVGALDQLANDLRALGVRSIRGGIVIDRDYFDTVNEPPHFDEQLKERAGFRAPVSSLMVNGNAVTVAIEPDPSGYANARVAVTPETPEYIRVVQAEVLTIVDGRDRFRIDTVVKRDHLQLKITGQIRADSGPFYTRRRIDDPVRFAGELIKRALARQEIRVGKKKIATGKTPVTARVLAVHESDTLGDVVRAMVKTSNNTVAEAVLKTIGAEARATPGPATWEDGLAAVRSHAVDTCQIGGALRIENGSGLFGSTDVTPAQLVQLLQCAHRDYRVGADLAGAMAIAGVDGTLARRLGTSTAKGRVRAKTGTLATVTTVAGYAAVDGQRPLAFAILVNDIPPGARGVARAMQDAMLDAMAVYLDAR
jgi:D-alanyl-D-alanine carboxypeptidase/D-alanyl-D-alanine-endopeptidase (penicillin-binding protein 4)